MNFPQGINPPILNRSYSITADVEIPDGGAEGVVVAAFDHLGGYSLFMMDGKLHHTYSFMGVEIYQHESDKPLPTGQVQLRLDFEVDAPAMAPAGTVTLFANDQPIGSGRMNHTVPILSPPTPAWTSAGTTARSSTSATRTRHPLPSLAPSTRSPTTSHPPAKLTTRPSTRPTPPAARPATSSPDPNLSRRPC
jgi:hypothetical protein